MDLDELPPPEEPIWPYRLWTILHLASALAFVVFVYLTGPSWPGVMMAFIVGVNVTSARYFAIFGDLVQRGDRNAAELRKLKDSYVRLAESIGYDPDAIEPKDRQE